jgi:hypothetical protein
VPVIARSIDFARGIAPFVSLEDTSKKFFVVQFRQASACLFLFQKETIEQPGLNTDWRYIRPISSKMIKMSKTSPNPPLG